MAERVDVVKDLEKEIICHSCQDHYTDPKILPCLHYYCKQCIYRLALRTGLDKPFSCPECRTDARCELCSGDKTEAFCQECAQFICPECVKAHQRSFSEHNIATLDEFKEGGVKEIITQESPLQTCKEHHQPMNMYCFDCSSLICPHCTIKNHKEHHHESIKQSAPQVKKKLIQQLEPLKEVHANLSRIVEEIQTNKCEVKAQGDSVINDIEESFDKLKRIIECRKQELLKEAATKVTQKLERLSVQEKSLSTEHEMVQSVLEYTEQCVDDLTEDEIMCMYGELENRKGRKAEDYYKGGVSLDPVEEVDIGVEVSCAEDLKQLCQTKAVIQLKNKIL